MNNTLQSLAAIALLLLIFSCSTRVSRTTVASRTQPINRAAWLIGAWENKSARGILYESWVRRDDSTFAGKSYFLKEKDTVILETVYIGQRHADLFYIPTVKGQNNEQPVTFTLTSSSDTQLVFENAAHDFPQKITYTRISSDSLLAEISGIVKGQSKSQRFPMRRSR